MSAAKILIESVPDRARQNLGLTICFSLNLPATMRLRDSKARTGGSPYDASSMILGFRWYSTCSDVEKAVRRTKEIPFGIILLPRVIQV